MALPLSACAWAGMVSLVYFAPTLGKDRAGLSDEGAPALGVSLDALVAVPRLAAAAAIFVAAYGLGGALLPRGLMAPLGPLERALSRMAAGLGVLAIVPLALSPLGLLRPAAMIAVLTVGVVLSAWTWLRGPRGSEGRVRLPRPRLTLEWLMAGLLALAAAFTLGGALAPEIEYDALWYHLEFPRRYLDAGSLVDDRCEYVSLYPMGTELLFGYGLALGGAVVAKLVHFGFWVLLALATYELGARVSSPRAGMLAAGVVALTPTVMWEGTTAYVDLSVAFFATVALGWVLRFAEAPTRGRLVAAALFAGFGAAAKTLGLVALAPLALLVAVMARGRAAARAALAGLLALVALTPALPWLVRAWIEGGNPVFPSLYGLFGAHADRFTEQAASQLEARLASPGKGDGVDALLALPWELTMDAAAFEGSLGVAYLALVPLAFTARPGRALAAVAGFGLAFLVLWASPLGSQQIRLLLPALPALAVVAAVGAERLALLAGRVHRLAAAVAAALVVALIASGLPPFVPFHERTGYLDHVPRGVPVGAVTGSEAEQAYLRRKLPGYDAIMALNRVAGPRDGALSLTDPYLDFYAEPRLLPDYSACLPIAGARAGDAVSEAAAARRLGVRFLVLQPRIATPQGYLALTRRPVPPTLGEPIYRDLRATVLRLRRLFSGRWP